VSPMYPACHLPHPDSDKQSPPRLEARSSQVARTGTGAESGALRTGAAPPDITLSPPNRRCTDTLTPLPEDPKPCGLDRYFKMCELLRMCRRGACTLLVACGQ
jgi:hypothetical protein